MPDPKEVFDEPSRFWDFLTLKSDSLFEGQFFDRKECCRPSSDGTVSKNQLSKLQEHITECVSGFSNSNQTGGLLVLGISSCGAIEGVKHLSETQLNSLTNLGVLLVGHTAHTRFVDCSDNSGNQNAVCLIYAPYAERCICETPGNFPKSWWRHGPQNLIITDSHKDVIKRDKGIVNFERTPCCPFYSDDLDSDVVKEFRQVFLQNTNNEYSDEETFQRAGALVNIKGERYITNAGYLFFASNPQREQPTSYIRLLRFNCNVEESENRGLPTFDKPFTGAITEQIRSIRAFFKQSGFFKNYQKRKREGGFVEEPEYPFIAIDEAIVNAVAHRDYGIGRVIECETYKNAFVVRNPGKVLQRDRDVPEQFSLQEFQLDSAPRNVQLTEWLKLMRDEQGDAFVKGLSEGTVSMRRAMTEIGLPAPVYKLSNAQTSVTLYNDYERREAELKAGYVDNPTEYANLYALNFDNRGGSLKSNQQSWQFKNLMTALKDSLSSNGWYVDSFKFSRIIAHRRGSHIRLSEKVDSVVRLFPAWNFQIREYWNEFYLCVDYTLEVKNVQNLRTALNHINLDEVIGKVATVNWNGWQLARVIDVNDDWANVFLFDYEREERIEIEKIIPRLSKKNIEKILSSSNVSFDLSKTIKQHSLSLEPSAARIRAEKTKSTVESISKNVFPFLVDNVRVTIDTKPVALSRRIDKTNKFQINTLPEPSVYFGSGKTESNIREGITKYGAYNESSNTIELVPICAEYLRDKMYALIDRLKVGKYKYRGSERTFHTRLSYSSIVTTNSAESIVGECNRLLQEHPEWVGDQSLKRLFLIHTPENDFQLDDETSPYYQVKRFLFERGLPCQMVDTPTLLNPDWKDLNLALNVVAKCGITPWVLPDAIPDADFFVGLSTTLNYSRGDTRQMGYANVFNEFGKWMFYSGNNKTFPYEHRAIHLKELVQKTLTRLNLTETPSIYFHYTAKFSKDDREAILKAARSIRPNGNYYFVWINTSHNVRLYDNRAETDGSLSRGSYVITSPNQIYLSTTGYNAYRKVLGTPHMLEINVRVERPVGEIRTPPDMKSIAAQILNLTKLNWASTDSLCAEPITTKYAHQIVYLTSAFLRQKEVFNLHPALEQTPWFI